MIIITNLDEGYIKYSSDKNVWIVQNETGMKYHCVIDKSPSQYTYSETDIPIENTKKRISSADFLKMMEDIL